MKAAAIDVVLFDLGGVLVETAGVDRMLEWSPGLVTADELWRRWLHSQAVRRFETGRIARDEFAAALVAEFAIPVGPDAFLAEFADWPRAVLPGAFELLSAMRARYRIANGLALHDAFHHNFPSFEVGKLKPDADYFEHVLQALDAPAHRVLFIDDNAINVDAAASLGMHARRVQGVHGARAAFVELGLLGDR
jgi:FMN phosphatase YigB (HAD superfamily)